MSRTDVTGHKSSAAHYRKAVSPDFSAKRTLPHPVRTLASWWKGRDSNPRPRHYELGAPLEIDFTFNNVAKGRPLRLTRLSTTEHDRFPQIPRNASMHLPPRPAWRDGERPEALKGGRELTAATAAGL